MLEKESMVARDTLGHDLTALRSLVLDGQWPEVEDVLRPLHSQSEVDTAGMLLEIRRQRFLELFEGTVRRHGWPLTVDSRRDTVQGVHDVSRSTTFGA
jgi:hypothetical protein